jgi:poly(A) polymerase Pap1
MNKSASTFAHLFFLILHPWKHPKHVVIMQISLGPL